MSFIMRKINPSLSPEELLAELEAFVGQNNAQARAQLQKKDPVLIAKIAQAAWKVSLALETPADVVARVFLAQPVEAITVRIACRLGVFGILKESNRPRTVKELAEATKADKTLLGRFLPFFSFFLSILPMLSFKISSSRPPRLGGVRSHQRSPSSRRARA